MVQTKALYNMLRISASTGAQIQAEPWAIENLRLFPIGDLWKRLEKLGIRLDPKSFTQFSSTCDSPEDLTDLIVNEEEEPSFYDQVYLLVFELWRRLFPERESLSIFADELDHLIEGYVKDELETDEAIQNSLAQLSDLLDEHIDRGMKPKDAITAISDYCANDLESFLYLYISDLLDQENSSYAQELLEEFASYFPKLTFEFLQVRLLSLTDPLEADKKLDVVLAKKPPLPLLFDILQFLITSGDHEIFVKTVRQIMPKLKTEEELQELIDLTADYFARLDKDDREQAILKIKANRRSTQEELNSSDPDIAKLKDIYFK